MEGKPTPSVVRAAFYARVSSEQQAQQCTIQSQVDAIKERIRADGLTLDDELCFIDDGYTGSTLMRPALERLRDIAWSGSFQRLYSFARSIGAQIRLASVACRRTATLRR